MLESTALELLSGFGLALAIGLLVGLERGWHTRDQSHGLRIAGIRTFALIGLLGATWGLLADHLGDVLLGFAFLGFCALLLTGYIAGLRRTKDYGMTTEIAALLTFALGVAAVQGYTALAAAAAVVMVGLLSFKPPMHGLIQHIKRFELEALIRFLLISVIILPALPNAGYGPGAALNPFQMWVMVVLISGLSFAGYITIRIAGPRKGILITSLLGGLASSTAVTVGFSRLGRRTVAVRPILAGGIVLANTVMFARILVVVGVFNSTLVPLLAPTIGLMTVICLVMGLLLIRGKTATEPSPPLEIRDPTEIITAIKFGVFLVVIFLLSYYVKLWLGEGGLYGLAAISGLADVDAITLAISQATLPPEVAAMGVVIAATVNTVIKTMIVAVAGERSMAIRVGAAFAAVITAGLVGLLAV